MQIRQGPEHSSLELRSGTAGGMRTSVGMVVGIAGFVISATAASGLLLSSSAFRHAPTPWWVLIMPVVFLCVALYFAGSGTRVRTLLRRHGESHSTSSSWFGLKKEETSFNAAAGHHLALHTDLRINRNKNGTTRFRISTLALVTRDGAENVIGQQRRGGVGGNQPLLEQAGEISLFLGVPLERTGYGAPLGYDMPPGQSPGDGGGLPEWIRGHGH